MFIENCSNNFYCYCVCILIKTIHDVLHFIIIFLKNWSVTCQTKTVLISVSSILLAAASFCIYQAHTRNKVGHHNETKSQGPCENEYKKYCLNGGECYYLVDEDIVGCIFKWLCGGNDVKSTYGATRLEFKIQKDEKF